MSVCQEYRNDALVSRISSENSMGGLATMDLASSSYLEEAYFPLITDKPTYVLQSVAIYREKIHYAV